MMGWKTTPQSQAAAAFLKIPLRSIAWKGHLRSMNKTGKKMQQNTKVRSIKGSLLRGMISLSVAICILFGLMISIILYRNTEDQVTTRINDNVTAYRDSVENAINNYKTKAEAIAQDAIISDTTLPLAQRKAEMKGLAASFGFDEVIVTDSEGATTNGSNISDRDYFQKAIVGTTNVSSTLARKNTDTITLMVAAEIKGGKGIVICVLSSDTFSQMIDDISIGTSGYGFIVDKDGKIIADKDRDHVKNFLNYIDEAEKDSSYAGIASVVKKMIAGKAGTQKVFFDGANRYIGYASIPDTENWSLGISVNEHEMMSNFYQSIVLTLILMVVFILISVLIAFRIANPIVNPILTLIKRIELLSDGDLHTEVPGLEKRDEIGVLARSFSNTIAALHGYVSEITEISTGLAAQDCTLETHQEYKGDFSAIGTALNNIIDNLNEIFGNIERSANQVASGADQVAGASQSLSQGATEQAASIEELSATITEIAKEVTENAENSKKASGYSQKVSEEVLRSNDKMKEMISAIEVINQSSDEIAKIIKTIQDIAFQTNILSLNAAVEAARAGAAGKGFAVVAEEVRNLANKSAEAADNTTALIENSVNAVHHGTKIADETAKSLNEIIGTSRNATDLIEKISDASNSQAESINQVNVGVDQISVVVQSNSATSEESAATSEELNKQATVLMDIMAQMKLKNVHLQLEHSGNAEQKAPDKPAK
jgi:methyl-accepting chemotaxis protein